MSNPKIARKERRVAARKRQIIEAALKVFLEKGFNQATTKEIAEAADIAEGTIYNYFKNKGDLLLEMISTLASLEERQKFFDESLDMDFQEFLVEYSRRRNRDLGDGYNLLISLLPALIENPTIRQRYNQEIVQPATDMFEKHLQERIDRGQLKPMEDLPLVTRLLTGASLGAWLLIILGDPVMLEAMKDPERFMNVGINTLYGQFLPDADET